MTQRKVTELIAARLWGKKSTSAVCHTPAAPALSPKCGTHTSPLFPGDARVTMMWFPFWKYPAVQQKEQRKGNHHVPNTLGAPDIVLGASMHGTLCPIFKQFCKAGQMSSLLQNMSSCGPEKGCALPRVKQPASAKAGS